MSDPIRRDVRCHRRQLFRTMYRDLGLPIPDDLKATTEDLELSG